MGCKQNNQGRDMVNIRLISTSLNSMENFIGITSITFETFPTISEALENLLISLPTIKPLFPDDVGANTNYVTRPLLEERI